MKTALLALALLVVSPDEPQRRPITLHTQPKVCFAPCDVRADVRIEPNDLNRWWVIQLDGPMLQSGARQLDGKNSAITQPPVWFKGLVPGDYDITAVVYRQQRVSEAGRAVTQVHVSGGQL
jgi:hypothetical protein